MRANFSLVLLPVCLVAALATSLKADVIIPNYSITALGTLGGTSSVAFGINNSGQVTGVSKTVSGGEQAFIYNGSVMSGLPSGGTAIMSSGARINDSGITVGTTFFAGSSHASYWTAAFGLLSNFGGTEGSAMSINNGGQIVGTSQFADGHAEAFVWNSGTMTALGVLNGGDWSSANDINSFGQVVGSASTQSGSFRAFTWTQGSGLQSLGTLGGSSSYAMSVNDVGLVTGNSQNAYGWTHAFRYFNGSMYDIGTLGGNNSYGYGTNTAGDVVGYSENSNGDTRAFFYRNGALVDLNSLLNTNPGWTLEEAYDINDKGQIVGVGTMNGQRLAFLLDPLAVQGPTQSPVTSPGFSTSGIDTPEPGTLLLVLAPLAALLLSRTR